ncbi:MAG: NAD(P)H-dependent oxidoreductase [Erythrobacter sp.]|nr:NAD(P)H-dependent oxidoreductase [Erythrobacter sp.]
MKVMLIDGHPDQGRFASCLLDCYAAALPDADTVTRVAARDLAFTPILRRGYAQRTEWEPDLARLATMIDDCDHLVIAFPMWWGSEPAELKGLIDRLFLPGFMFAYHQDDPWWDRLMAGRSADVIITMDTPPLFLWLSYGNAIIRRWKGQVLGFVGFAPVRVLACGPVRKGGAEKSLAKWQAKIERLARTVRTKAPDKKQARLPAFLNRVSP